MLFMLDDLRGYPISATDGEIGKATDFYFDDSHWVLRYMVVSTGWLFGRDVLISPEAINDISREEKNIAVSLSKKQIEDGPGTGTDLPVSQQQELRLREYYGWSDYTDYASASLADVPVAPFRLKEMPAGDDHGESAVLDRSDPHLRSAQEVTGYRIEANDGEIGHVEDLVIDPESWAVRYLVIDTRNWLPGRKVIIAPEWAHSIDWSETIVRVDRTKDFIQNSPEFDLNKDIARDYEEKIYKYYGETPYWF